MNQHSYMKNWGNYRREQTDNGEAFWRLLAILALVGFGLALIVIFLLLWPYIPLVFGANNV